MRVKCSLNSKEIIPGDVSKSLKRMSDTVTNIVTILKLNGAENVNVNMTPDSGFILSFECYLFQSSEIFRDLRALNPK